MCWNFQVVRVRSGGVSERRFDRYTPVCAFAILLRIVRFLSNLRGKCPPALSQLFSHLSKLPVRRRDASDSDRYNYVEHYCYTSKTLNLCEM